MNLSKLINLLVTYYNLPPKVINSGLCGDFAHIIWEQTKGLVETTNTQEVFEQDEPWHVWITFEGKHYDAECPNGVEKPEDLPFFKRY